MYCTYCKSKLPDDATFCTSCGLAITNSPNSQPTMVPNTGTKSSSGFSLFGSKKKESAPVQKQTPVYDSNPVPAPAPIPAPQPTPVQQPISQPAAPTSFAPVEPAAPVSPFTPAGPTVAASPFSPAGPTVATSPFSPEGPTATTPVFSPEPTPEPAPTPMFSPEPEPVSEPAPAPIFNPEPEPVPEPAPTPIFNPEPEPVSEPAPAPVTSPEPEPVSEPALAPVTSPEPEPVPEPAPAPVTNPEPAPVSANSPEPAPAWQPSPAKKINLIAIICAVVALISGIGALLIGCFRIGGEIERYVDAETISGLSILRLASEMSGDVDVLATVIVGFVGFSLTILAGLSVIFAIVGLIMAFTGTPKIRGMIKASYALSLSWGIVCIAIWFIVSTIAAFTFGLVEITMTVPFWCLFALSAVSLGMLLPELEASLERKRLGITKTSAGYSIANSKRYAKYIYSIAFAVVCILVCTTRFSLSSELVRMIPRNALPFSIDSVSFSPFQILLACFAALITIRVNTAPALLVTAFFAVIVLLEILVIKNCAVAFFKAPTAVNMKKIRKAGTKARVEVIIWAVLLLLASVITNLGFMSVLRLKTLNLSIISLSGNVLFLFILAVFCLGILSDLIDIVSFEGYSLSGIDLKGLAMLAVLTVSVLCGYLYVVGYYDGSCGYLGFLSFAEGLPFYTDSAYIISLLFAAVITVLGVFPLRSYLSYIESMFRANSNEHMLKSVNTFSIMNLVSCGLLLLYSLFLYIIEERFDLMLTYGGFFIIQASIFCLIISHRMFKSEIH